MPVTIRKASSADTRQMSELLNEIIAAGGTTAMSGAISAKDLAKWMQTDADQSAWHVAEDHHGTIMGFQMLIPHQDLPPEAADIATFVRSGATQMGIGSKLFAATEKAGVSLGYLWLNATIRANNSGGLTYYQSRGFRDWRIDQDVPLADGTLENRISKRFDL
ncbi:MAG: GNAT family N-acetyltransferase [Paracoccaceae bacterium]